MYTDPMTGVQSIYYRVSVSRSVSYADLMKMNKKGYDLSHDIIQRKFYKSKYWSYIIYIYHDDFSPKNWKKDTQLHLVRPSTGPAANVWTLEDITDKYVEVTEDAEKLWTQAERQAQTQCAHGPSCPRHNCQVGKAIQTVHIIAGQFVVLWGYLQTCVPKGKTLRLVQVSAKKGDEEVLITGVRILGAMSEGLKAKLKALEDMQRREVEKQKQLTEEHKKRRREAYEKGLERKRQREMNRTMEDQIRSLTSRQEWQDIMGYSRVLRRAAARRYPVSHDSSMPSLIPLYGSEGMKILCDTAKSLILNVEVPKDLPGLYPLTRTEEICIGEKEMNPEIEDSESSKEESIVLSDDTISLSGDSVSSNSSLKDSSLADSSTLDSVSSNSSQLQDLSESPLSIDSTSVKNDKL